MCLEPQHEDPELTARRERIKLLEALVEETHRKTLESVEEARAAAVDFSGKVKKSGNTSRIFLRANGPCKNGTTNGVVPNLNGTSKVVCACRQAICICDQAKGKATA